MKVQDIADILIEKGNDLRHRKKGVTVYYAAGTTRPESSRFLRAYSFRALVTFYKDFVDLSFPLQHRNTVLDTTNKADYIKAIESYLAITLVGHLVNYSATTCFNAIFSSNRHHKASVHHFLSTHNYIRADGSLNTTPAPKIANLVSELDGLVREIRASGRQVNPQGTLQEWVDFSKFLNAVNTEIKTKIEAVDARPAVRDSRPLGYHA